MNWLVVMADWSLSESMPIWPVFGMPLEAKKIRASWYLFEGTVIWPVAGSKTGLNSEVLKASMAVC